MSSLLQSFLDKIFSNKLSFEKEILGVNCDEDRKDVMSLICTELCTNSSIVTQVNFLKLNSVDDLDFKGVPIALVQILLEELLSFLKDNNFDENDISRIKENKLYLKFLYELSQIYMRRFSSLFYKEVVNTFFDLISIADKPEKLNPVVNEVILGKNKTKSLFLVSGSGQILYKQDQAWMRVKQAKDDKSSQIQVIQVEIVKLTHRIEYLRLHISAIVAARALSVDDTKLISSKLLLDMFTDEDNVQLQTKKTMFTYIENPDVLNSLMQIAITASSNSKAPLEKAHFKQISNFFKKTQGLNTEVFLKEKFDEYKAELEVKGKLYHEKMLKITSLRSKPLDSFDLTLKKIKEAMVYNLQHL